MIFFKYVLDRSYIIEKITYIFIIFLNRQCFRTLEHCLDNTYSHHTLHSSHPFVPIVSAIGYGQGFLSYEIILSVCFSFSFLRNKTIQLMND